MISKKLFIFLAIFKATDKHREITLNADGNFMVWRDSASTTPMDGLNLSVLKGKQVHHIPIEVKISFLVTLN